MKTRVALLLFLLTLSTAVFADSKPTNTYSVLVDKAGNIRLPENFRSEWVFLGTWSIAEKEVEISAEASHHGAAGLHNVYTQPGVAEYFRENRTFPDGAVIVKELLKASTGSMTTGTVSHGVEVEGWFVMVKDAKGRFAGNTLWGDGWGWTLFNASAPATSVTENYKTECLGCHIPAREDDWIYISGYPVLND